MKSQRLVSKSRKTSTEQRGNCRVQRRFTEGRVRSLIEPLMIGYQLVDRLKAYSEMLYDADDQSETTSDFQDAIGMRVRKLGESLLDAQWDLSRGYADLVRRHTLHRVTWQVECAEDLCKALECHLFPSNVISIDFRASSDKPN